MNDMLEEAVEVMRELVHPNAMHEALRVCIMAILEKKQEDRVKFNTFLVGLYSSGLLSGEQVGREWTALQIKLLISSVLCGQTVVGLSKFLESYDDIVIDVPRVGDYTASIFAHLYVTGALEDMSFILTFPDEHNFSLSMGIFDLLVKVRV